MVFGARARCAAMPHDVPGNSNSRPNERYRAYDINATQNQHRGQDNKCGGHPAGSPGGIGSNRRDSQTPLICVCARSGIGVGIRRNFLDDVARPGLRLDIDLCKILADHAHAQQLHAAEHVKRDDGGRPAGNRGRIYDPDLQSPGSHPETDE